MWQKVVRFLKSVARGMIVGAIIGATGGMIWMPIADMVSPADTTE